MKRNFPSMYYYSYSSASSGSACPEKPDDTQKIRRITGEVPSAHFSGISTTLRGVTWHKWTGRYEVHLWDKGRQVYFGAYENEEAAAHAYDLAALRYWGLTAVLNFPVSTYLEEYGEMMTVNREKYLISLRHRSIGSNQGVSKYHGVTRKQDGTWEARVFRIYDSQYHFVGTYGTEEEAARAHDKAAIEYEGSNNAITNFDKNCYKQQSPALQPQPSPPRAPVQMFAPVLFRDDVLHLSAPPQPTQTEPLPPVVESIPQSTQMFAPVLFRDDVMYLSAPPQPTQTEPMPPVIESIPQSSMQTPSLEQNEYFEEALELDIEVVQNDGTEVHRLMDPVAWSNFMDELTWNAYLEPNPEPCVEPNPEPEEPFNPDEILDDDLLQFLSAGL